MFPQGIRAGIGNLWLHAVALEGTALCPLLLARPGDLPVSVVSLIRAVKIAFACFLVRIAGILILACVGFIPFQQWIGVQGILDIFTKFDPVELQQADSLLQLRRQGELLCELELE